MSFQDNLERRVEKLSKGLSDVFFILNRILDAYSPSVAPMWLAILERLHIDGRKILILFQEICNNEDDKFFLILATISKNPEYVSTLNNGRTVKVLHYLKSI